MNIFDITDILTLASEPTSREALNEWIGQKDIIPFLEQELEDENIIVYANFTHIFIHAILIPHVTLTQDAINQLLHWNHNPYSTWSIVTSAKKAWIDPPLATSNNSLVSAGEQIIFARSFEGDSSRHRYFEMN